MPDAVFHTQFKKLGNYPLRNAERSREKMLRSAVATRAELERIVGMGKTNDEVMDMQVRPPDQIPMPNDSIRTESTLGERQKMINHCLASVIEAALTFLFALTFQDALKWTAEKLLPHSGYEWVAKYLITFFFLVLMLFFAVCFCA